MDLQYMSVTEELMSDSNYHPAGYLHSYDSYVQLLEYSMYQGKQIYFGLLS